MAYVAIKPCSLAGQKFLIGDTVPAEFILPGNANNLVKMGLIAETSDHEPTTKAAPETSPEIKVTIHAAEGDMELEPTQEGLQAILDVLTGKVDAAEPVINAMTDEDALILLHVTDNRKSIKELAENRAKELNGSEE